MFEFKSGTDHDGSVVVWQAGVWWRQGESSATQGFPAERQRRQRHHICLPHLTPLDRPVDSCCPLAPRTSLIHWPSALTQLQRNLLIAISVGLTRSTHSFILYSDSATKKTLDNWTPTLHHSFTLYIDSATKKTLDSWTPTLIHLLSTLTLLQRNHLTAVVCWTPTLHSCSYPPHWHCYKETIW